MIKRTRLPTTIMAITVIWIYAGTAKLAASEDIGICLHAIVAIDKENKNMRGMYSLTSYILDRTNKWLTISDIG